MASECERPLRILVLGASGRLGSALVRSWSGHPGLEIQGLGHAQINLANPVLMDRTLGAMEFDWLINCAAYTAVDDCESHPDHADQVNGRAPGQLARTCAAQGARMIQFSTDYVFDGRKEEPYTEDDAAHPISAYGRSKRLGEELVRAASPRHLVVRLSWLFGPGRPAFPEWVVREAAKGSIRVVADKVACPTYSLDVARWLRPVLDGDLDPGGMLHLCNPPPCAWIEYARGVLETAGLSVAVEPISLADLPGLAAPRPRQSALSVAKYERLTGATCRPWREALSDHWR